MNERWFKSFVLEPTSTTLLEQDLFYRIVLLHPWLIRRQVLKPGWWVNDLWARAWLTARIQSLCFVWCCRWSFLVRSPWLRVAHRLSDRSSNLFALLQLNNGHLDIFFATNNDGIRTVLRLKGILMLCCVWRNIWVKYFNWLFFNVCPPIKRGDLLLVFAISNTIF